MREIGGLLTVVCIVALGFISWGGYRLDQIIDNRRLQIAVQLGDNPAAIKALRDGANAGLTIDPLSEKLLLEQELRLGNEQLVAELLERSKVISTLSGSQLGTIATAAVQQRNGEVLRALSAAGWRATSEQIFAMASLPNASVESLSLFKRYPRLYREPVNGALRQALLTLSLRQAELLIAGGANLYEIQAGVCCAHSGGSMLTPSGQFGTAVSGYTLRWPKGMQVGALQTIAREPYANEMLRWAVQVRGVNVNAADSDGKTALMWAAIERNYWNMLTLLELGANPNQRDIDGRTALMYAIIPTPRLGRSGPVTLGSRRDPAYEFTRKGFAELINKGLSITLSDNDQLTAINYANAFPRSPRSRALLGAVEQLEL